MTTEPIEHAGATSTLVHAPAITCPPPTQDWSGPICPSCHHEEFRFRNGVCVYCDKKREAAKELAEGKKRERRYVGMLLDRGLITLAQARNGEY